jgi:hypothetical protein
MSPHPESYFYRLDERIYGKLIIIKRIKSRKQGERR